MKHENEIEVDVIDSTSVNELMRDIRVQNWFPRLGFQVKLKVSGEGYWESEVVT